MVTLTAQIISENKDKLNFTINYLRKLNIFDEIAVVADLDNGDDIEDIAKLADKYYLMNMLAPEQAINKINEISSGDWNFRIDDDELIGDVFFTNIKDFIQNAEKDSYWMPRMWSWPDKYHFLNCYHWYPDYQIRLWKKGHLKAVSGFHMHPNPIGSSGTLMYHLFHLTLIQNNYESRLLKCRHHSELMGIPFEHFLKGIGLFYLPEDIDNLIISDPLERMVE